jgi:hypothetical protein
MYRMAIGYLGEKDQSGWWQSSFLTPGSKAFMAPVFGRTQVLAQCTGVTRAAAMVHDERIGVGNVYHLFRLPEDMEQAIHRALHDPDLCKKSMALLTSKDAATQYLSRQVALQLFSGVGPTRVGDTNNLRSAEYWRTVAGYYLHGFEQGSEVYPYFSDKS